MEELKYFFSYARKDSEFVLKLATELRAVGVKVWLDQLDILGGQHWDRAVEGALEACQGMIAVLSPESVASNNAMDEVSYALEEGKLIVPILLRSCAIPFRLRRVQYIDFTASYDTGFPQLLRALRIDQLSYPLEGATPKEPVVRDITVSSEEMLTEVPNLEQLGGKTKLPEPENQGPQEVEEPKAETTAKVGSDTLEAQTVQRPATQKTESPSTSAVTTSSETITREEPTDQCKICGARFARSKILAHVKTHA